MGEKKYKIAKEQNEKETSHPVVPALAASESPMRDAPQEVQKEHWCAEYKTSQSPLLKIKQIMFSFLFSNHYVLHQWGFQ